MDEQRAQNRAERMPSSAGRSTEGRRHRQRRPPVGSRTTASARGSTSRGFLRGTDFEEDHFAVTDSQVNEPASASQRPHKDSTPQGDMVKTRPSTSGGIAHAVEQHASLASSAERLQVHSKPSGAKELYALRAEVARLRLRCEELELELARVRLQTPHGAPTSLPVPADHSASEPILEVKSAAVGSANAETLSMTARRASQASRRTPPIERRPGESVADWSASDIVLDWADEMETTEPQAEHPGQRQPSWENRAALRAAQGSATARTGTGVGVSSQKVLSSPERPRSKHSMNVSSAGEKIAGRIMQGHRATANESGPRHHQTAAERHPAAVPGLFSRTNRPAKKSTKPGLEAVSTPMVVSKPPASAWLLATRSRVSVERLRALLPLPRRERALEHDPVVTISFHVSRWNDDRLIDKEMVRSLIQLWQKLPSPTADSEDTAASARRKAAAPFTHLLLNKEELDDRPLERSEVWALAAPVLTEACRHPTLLILHDCQGLNDKSMQAARFNVAYFVEAVAAAREQLHTETSSPPKLFLVLEGYPVHRRPVLGGHQVYAVNL